MKLLKNFARLIMSIIFQLVMYEAPNNFTFILVLGVQSFCFGSFYKMGFYLMILIIRCTIFFNLPSSIHISCFLNCFPTIKFWLSQFLLLNCRWLYKFWQNPLSDPCFINRFSYWVLCFSFFTDIFCVRQVFNWN
jgi:hypothetical protein